MTTNQLIKTWRDASNSSILIEQPSINNELLNKVSGGGLPSAGHICTVSAECYVGDNGPTSGPSCAHLFEKVTDFLKILF